MAKTRIRRIDDLLAAAGGVPAIVPGDGDTAAVGAVQELLRSHGYSRLPDMRHSSYGSFGELTRQSVLAYRAIAGLGNSPRVDGPLLEHMLRRDPQIPLAARCYLTKTLDFEYTPMAGVVALTALSESGGRFACMNLNTDRCGLSFGIIQWAQRPGRLHELLMAFRKAAPEAIAEIAGGPAAVDALIAHTARPGGGVDPVTGAALDSRFDLIREPWRGRFERIGRTRTLQKVQMEAALRVFQASLAQLQPVVPVVNSQRGFAFLLDVANQHGDSGARSICRAVAKSGMGEAQLLAAVEKESVRRVAAQYGAASPEAASTANRREFFRTLPWLSDAAGAVA
ncbi:MAG TPA: hypothetical protein VN442_13940 [Bryobacteraceae bacterium]|nr:hypothetical protein [Bryobacteraceae bacterium]